MIHMCLVIYSLLLLTTHPLAHASDEANQIEASHLKNTVTQDEKIPAVRRLVQWPPPASPIRATAKPTVIEKQPCLLFEMSNDVFLYVIKLLDRPQDMARFSRTCRSINEFIMAQPFAPGHFHEVMFRAVQPRLRMRVPLSDFIQAFALDTTKGRKAFYEGVTVAGFLKLIKDPGFGGYFLGNGYRKAKKVLKNRLEEFSTGGGAGNVEIPGNCRIFPPEMVGLTYLESIRFPKTFLYTLPRKLDQITGLKHLVCTHGFIRSIPEELGNLGQLEIVDLSYNLITNIPESMGKVESLRELNLEGNRLTEFPSCLLGLTQLSILTIGSNRFSRLPYNIGLMQGLKTLGVANSSDKNNQDVGYLTELPYEIGRLSALERLDLRGQHLVELPSGFHRLTNLRSLDLSSNPVEIFPPSLLSLHSLRTLKLAHTGLVTLPPSLSELIGLHELDLRGTGINQLPEEMKFLAPYMDIKLQ